MKLLFSIFIIFPSLVFSFSETELESLEDSGTKTFSKSPWRRDTGFSLIRNLDIETRHKHFSTEEQKQENSSAKKNRFCDPDKEGSLCDFSNLYYKWDFTLYYSVVSWVEKYFNSSFLKDTEFFLGGSFTSNFKGGACSHLKGYNSLTGYLKCGIGDILGGWTTPIYQKDSFFSFFNFTMVAWPLSKESQSATLKTAIDGSLNTLYFIKKQKEWSWALSSSHSLAYNHFTVPATDNGHNYNNPFDSSQQLSLIFKQRFNKYLPSNTSLSVAYSSTINTDNTSWLARYVEAEQTKYNFFNVVSEDHKKYLETVVKEKCRPKGKIESVIACGNRYQHLSLGISSSWRLDHRVYLTLSVRWKNLIKAYSPLNKYLPVTINKTQFNKVRLSQPPSLYLQNWYFYLRASYSF